MRRHAFLFAATALLAAGKGFAQTPPTPPVAPPPAETDKKADPLQPQKAEQEPRPVAQEQQKAASQGGPGAPIAAPADPKKWDVSARHGPGHDVPIDTRSGTWLSLDVSPDGSKTAYSPTLVVAYGGSFGENYWYQHTDVWKEPILSRWVPRRILDARSRRRTMIPDEETNLLSISASAKRISDLGVPTSIGAHGQREGLGAHWDI